MRAAIPWVPLLALALAGCVAPSSDEPHRFGGSFTEGATQEDMEDFQRRMAAHGAQDTLLLESFPVQFSVEGVPGANCDAARTEAESLPYVGQAGTCVPSRR